MAYQVAVLVAWHLKRNITGHQVHFFLSSDHRGSQLSAGESTKRARKVVNTNQSINQSIKQANKQPSHHKPRSNVTVYEAVVCPQMAAYVTNEHLNGFPFVTNELELSFDTLSYNQSSFLSANTEEKPIDISWTSFTPYMLENHPK